MKLILAVVFALTATTAIAGDGRYTTITVNLASRANILITDTKEGRLKFCHIFQKGNFAEYRCGEWESIAE